MCETPVWSSLIHFGQIRSDLIQKTWPCLFSWYTWQCFIATFFDKWGIQIWSSLIHFQQIWSDKWTFSNWRKLKELENTNFNHNIWKKGEKWIYVDFWENIIIYGQKIQDDWKIAISEPAHPGGRERKNHRHLT